MYNPGAITDNLDDIMRVRYDVERLVVEMESYLEKYDLHNDGRKDYTDCVKSLKSAIKDLYDSQFCLSKVEDYEMEKFWEWQESL